MSRYSMIGSGLAAALLMSGWAAAAAGQETPQTPRRRQPKPEPQPAPQPRAANLPGETNRQFAARMKAEGAEG